MKYAALLALILLSACSEKTCAEKGGEIKAMAPIMFMEGDKLKTVYPTECVK
jgi:hypothetical protein